MTQIPDDSQGVDVPLVEGETLAVGTVAAQDGKDANDSDPRARLMSRPEAAKAFNVSITTFRRRIENRLLTPIIGPDGAHYFPEERVHELVVQQRSTSAAPDTYDGETASAVFALLEQGVQPVEVVTRLKLHPRSVAAIHQEWVSFRGGYVVTAKVARDIASLHWMWGSFPICSGEDLLKNLRASTPRGLCTDCGDTTAELCPVCAAKLLQRNAERRAAEARERREDAEHRRRMAEWPDDFGAMLRRKPKKPTT